MRLKTLCTAITYITLGSQLVACGSNGEDAATGQLNLSLTDAPVDGAEKVVVKFTGVEIKAHDDERYTFTFDEPRQIDLLDLQGTLRTPLLEGVELKAGEYKEIRLQVVSDKHTTDSYIQLTEQGDSQYPLYVPSGSQSGLKLHHDFIVAAGGLTDLTIDFDVRKSVKNPQSGDWYKLDPSLRIVDNAQVGTLQGTVDTSLLMAEGCTADPQTGAGSAVYLYQGANHAVVDVSGSDDDPLTSALVSYNATSGTFEYTIGYVLQGDYTIAFTCQAGNDDPELENAPETENPVHFVQPQTVSVTAGATSTVDFVALSPAASAEAELAARF